MAKESKDMVVLIDGPNVDMVLGQCVLGHRPEPGQRPDWKRVRQSLVCRFGAGEFRFFLNGRHFDSAGVFAFRRCLRELRYNPIVVQRNADEVGDPVDRAIVEAIRQLAVADQGIQGRSRIVLLSHDGGFTEVLESYLGAGGGVAICGFIEEMARPLIGLGDAGAEIIDLEHDLGGFNVGLGRPYRPQALTVDDWLPTLSSAL